MTTIERPGPVRACSTTARASSTPAVNSPRAPLTQIDYAASHDPVIPLIGDTRIGGSGRAPAQSIGPARRPRAVAPSWTPRANRSRTCEQLTSPIDRPILAPLNQPQMSRGRDSTASGGPTLRA